MVITTHIEKKNLMLILTRRADERIFIGDDITLSVLDIEGNRVRLGLEAPKNVAILREEIHEKYSAEAAGDSHANEIKITRKSA